MNSLGKIYEEHHKSRRGEGFVLLGDVRGEFLRTKVGTEKKVLDIGCRDGALTSSYATGNNVLGLDIDAHALSKASTDLGIETRIMDLNGDWDLPAHSFDAVVAAEVMEHLYYPDVVAGKIATALKDTGVLLGSVPNAFSLKNRLRWFMLKKKNTSMEDPTHINQFIVSELEHVLKKHFKEVHIYGAGRHQWIAAKFPQMFAFDLLFEARYPLR